MLFKQELEESKGTSHVGIEQGLQRPWGGSVLGISEEWESSWRSSWLDWGERGESGWRGGKSNRGGSLIVTVRTLGLSRHSINVG